jgi:dolichol-phosphate mannosyltransferase
MPFAGNSGSRLFDRESGMTIDWQPALSIVVPIYNEERTLTSVIEQIYAACGSFAEVIFVDDGSTDSSHGILVRNARPTDRIVRKSNGGKGSAVRAAFNLIRGEYTIIQDADLEYNPWDIPQLLAFAKQRALYVLYGSRRLKRQKQYAHVAYYLGGCLLTLIFNVLYGTRLTDVATCYKVVRTDIMRKLPLKEDDFRFDSELTSLLTLQRIPIVERPISYKPRSIAEGKKITWRDWFKSLWVTLKLRVCGRLPAAIHGHPG